MYRTNEDSCHHRVNHPCLAALLFAVLIAVPAVGDQAKSPRAVVEGLVEGFNTHEFDAMAPYIAADVKWLSVAGDSVVMEAEGIDALREAMTSYFSSIPSTRSEIVDAMVSDPYVIVREQANWSEGPRRRTQSAIAVYRIENGLIAQVWYYPADRALAFKPEAPISDVARVRLLLDAYVKAWAKNDADAVMSVFVETPVLMPAGREPIVGQEAARAFWFPPGGTTRVVAYVDSIADIEVSGDLAYARGTADMMFEWREGGETKRQSNHSAHLTVLRRGTDGIWRIAQRMWGRVSD